METTWTARGTQSRCETQWGSRDFVANSALGDNRACATEKQKPEY